MDRSAQIQIQRTEAWSRIDDISRDAREHQRRIAANLTASRIADEHRDTEEENHNGPSAQCGFQGRHAT
jgi:hypothetical protein